MGSGGKGFELVMLPHAGRSKAYIAGTRDQAHSATCPSFVIANSIASLPFFISADSGIRRYQLLRTTCDDALQIGPEVHALGVTENLERSGWRPFCAGAQTEITTLTTALRDLLRRLALPAGSLNPQSSAPANLLKLLLGRAGVCNCAV